MRLLPLSPIAMSVGLAVFGQSLSFAAQEAPAPHDCAEHEHVYLMTLWPMSQDWLGDYFGLIPVCEEPALGMYAFRPHPGTTQGELDSLVAAAESSWVTVAAARDRRSAVPDVEGCSVLDAIVTIQDCTVGFVSGGTPQDPCGTNPWLQQIGVDLAAEPKGTTKVAVIDTGVDPDHPALVGRLAGPGYDYLKGQAGGYFSVDGIDDDGDGLVDEGAYHGTQVASLICQVDPGARILPYRVCDTEGNGRGYSVARAVIRAVAEGADVINLSLSFGSKHHGVDLALRLAMLAGVEVCVAAGNTGSDTLLFPATFQEDPNKSYTIWKYPYGVLTVSSVDEYNQRAYFGSWGESVDLVAPGTNLCAAAPGGTWAPFSGTSAAAAVAAGALSRVLSTGDIDPVADSAVELLVGTTMPLDYGDVEWNGQLGAGLVNLSLAVGAVQGF